MVENRAPRVRKVDTLTEKKREKRGDTFFIWEALTATIRHKI